MSSYFSNALPADLDARLVVARAKAQLVFDEAKAREPRQKHRELLIDLRIKPEVIAFGQVAREMATRGWLAVGQIESVVDDYRQMLAHQLCPDPHTHSASDDVFQREVRDRLHRSEEWHQHRAAVIQTAEQLAQPKTIGDTINRLRQDCGWTFDDLAAITEQAKTTVLSHTGNRSMPSPDALSVYAAEFSQKLGRTVTVKELLHGSGPARPKRDQHTTKTRPKRDQHTTKTRPKRD